MTAGFPSCNCLHNLSRKWRVTALSVSKSGDSATDRLLRQCYIKCPGDWWPDNLANCEKFTILFFRLTPSFSKKSEVILIQHLAKRALCYALIAVIAFIIAETSK